jgi:hypothetical protein
MAINDSSSAAAEETEIVSTEEQHARRWRAKSAKLEDEMRGQTV